MVQFAILVGGAGARTPEQSLVLSQPPMQAMHPNGVAEANKRWLVTGEITLQVAWWLVTMLSLWPAHGPLPICWTFHTTNTKGGQPNPTNPTTDPTGRLTTKPVHHLQTTNATLFTQILTNYLPIPDSRYKVNKSSEAPKLVSSIISDKRPPYSINCYFRVSILKKSFRQGCI